PADAQGGEPIGGGAHHGRGRGGRRVVLTEGDGVVAGEAGGAQAGFGQGRRFDHSLDRDIPEGISAERGAHLVHGEAVGHEFGPRGEVDPVEAGRLHRWGGGPHVYVCRAR